MVKNSKLAPAVAKLAVAKPAVAKSAEAERVNNVKVKKDQLLKAVSALVQLSKKRSANANPLFGSNSETMQVIFNLSTIPQGKMKPMLIELPHPLYDDKSEVCFIAKDPQKQYKQMLLEKHPVPGLTKVIGLTKLKKNYATAESKRALADSFDLFLCDSRVVEMMPKILGSIFYDKKLKRPLPVRMDYLNPAPNLRKAIAGTTLRMPSGPCVGVKIGKCSMDEAHLAANAAAVVSFATKYLAGNPVQTISIQATDSPALPIWRRTAPPGEALDLKKHHSDAMSSSASDTGTGNVSETEDTNSIHGSELPSDVGETFDSSRASGLSDTGGESLSEVETAGSELDSEDVGGDHILDEHRPLLKGLKGRLCKRKRKQAADAQAAAEAEATKGKKAPAAAAAESMPPPKKAKKSKA